MSWLSEIERMYFFKCCCGHDFSVVGTNLDLDKSGKRMCPECRQGNPEYKGFQNVDEINLSGRVKRKTYEQNGRKAMKIGSTYMSQTKYNYLETGKIENAYTPQYEAQLRKDEEKNEYLLKTETNKRRAMVEAFKVSQNKRAYSKTY